MIATGATLVLRSLRGSREVGAEDFFLGTYETAAQQDEMLVEIRIPGVRAQTAGPSPRSATGTAILPSP